MNPSELDFGRDIPVLNTSSLLMNLQPRIVPLPKSTGPVKKKNIPPKPSTPLVSRVLASLLLPKLWSLLVNMNEWSLPVLTSKTDHAYSLKY